MLGARPLGAGPLVLGMDVALCRDDVALLCTSVRYRGTALPIAWGIVPATTPGAREPHWERMLRGIARVIPPTQQVRVRADQGLGSPQLWHAIHSHGFHPIMRVHVDASFAPPGQPRHPMRSFVPVAGLGWMGTGAAFKHAPKRMAGTLAVVWVEPWALLTDLPPDQMDAAWYALRMWDAAGFRQS